MSIIKFDEWHNAAGVPYKTLVNVFTHSDYSYQSTAPYNTTTYGYNGNYNSPPTATQNAGTLGEFGFAPKYSDSTLIIHTSMFTFAETSNVADDFRLWIDDSEQVAIWRKMDSSYNQFAGGLNAGYLSLHGEFPNYGNSTAKNFRIRWDTSGSTGSSYQVMGRYNSSWLAAPYYLTIMEYR